MQTQLHQRHYDSDTNSMPEGNLKNLPAWNKSDTPALEVTMEQPEKVYLRGQVYDTYTGTGWKAADTEETAQYEDLFYWLHEANFYGQSQIDLTEEDQTVTLTGSIGAKGESSQTILLQSSFCGRVYVQISRFTLLDYLGLLPMKALVKADARLTILPDLYPMEADMTARPAYADDGASNRRGEDRSEVYQLREYRPGDDIRQIHWKLSSKLDELILKEASQPESRSLLVFWDKRTGGNPQQMDALAEVVSSAGMALLQSGVPYTLCWTDRDDRSSYP